MTKQQKISRIGETGQEERKCLDCGTWKNISEFKVVKDRHGNPLTRWICVLCFNLKRMSEPSRVNQPVAEKREHHRKMEANRREKNREEYNKNHKLWIRKRRLRKVLEKHLSNDK